MEAATPRSPSFGGGCEHQQGQHPPQCHSACGRRSGDGAAGGQASPPRSPSTRPGVGSSQQRGWKLARRAVCRLGTTPPALCGCHEVSQSLQRRFPPKIPAQQRALVKGPTFLKRDGIKIFLSLSPMWLDAQPF